MTVSEEEKTGAPAETPAEVNPVAEDAARESKDDGDGGGTDETPPRAGCEECAKREDLVVKARKDALAAGTPFMPLRRQHRLLLSAPVHDAVFTVSLLTGARRRLSCPQCHAVGTFKPHGGLANFILDYREADKQQPKWPTRMVRRWLCKNCGYYIGPEGLTTHCFVDEVWRLPGQDGWESAKTPRAILRENKVDPWWG